MDWDIWFVAIGLIVVSSALSYYYFEVPTSILLAAGFAIIIYASAIIIDKYIKKLDINKGSRTE